jgi:hypothetical protein
VTCNAYLIADTLLYQREQPSIFNRLAKMAAEEKMESEKDGKERARLRKLRDEFVEECEMAGVKNHEVYIAESERQREADQEKHRQYLRCSPLEQFMDDASPDFKKWMAARGEYSIPESAENPISQRELYAALLGSSDNVSEKKGAI